MPAAIPPGIRAVFFDAVGTLLFPNPPALDVYCEVACRAGLELSAAEARTRFLEAYRGQEEIDRVAEWMTTEARERKRWRSIVSATLRGVSDPDACFHELFDHFARPSAWRLADDAGPVIDGLSKRGYILGMGSNYDSRLWSVLDGYPELTPLCERIVISAAIGFRKPAKEFFQEMVGVAGCDRSHVLFVGDDRANDYDGAIAAGLNALLLDDANRHEHVKRIACLTELNEIAN